MSSSFDPGATLPAAGAARPAAPRRSAYHLTLVEGEPLRRSVPLAAERLVLGRDPSRAFYLTDPRVSRSHCEVWLERSTVLVRDLSSTNGTRIDGEPLAGERLLRTGSLLQLGRYAFRLELLGREELERTEELARDLDRARRYVQELLPPPLAEGRVHTEWCFVPSTVLGGDALGYGALAD